MRKGCPAGSGETVTAGSSTLSYDALADQYVYVWKSDKAWGGMCRQLQVKLAEGSTARTANFNFTRWIETPFREEGTSVQSAPPRGAPLWAGARASGPEPEGRGRATSEDGPGGLGSTTCRRGTDQTSGPPITSM